MVIGAWPAVIAAQVYLAIRLTLRLVSLSAAATWFQASLAHAGYVAATMPVPGDPVSVAGVEGTRGV